MFIILEGWSKRKSFNKVFHFIKTLFVILYNYCRLSLMFEIILFQNDPVSLIRTLSKHSLHQMFDIGFL